MCPRRYYNSGIKPEWAILIETLRPLQAGRYKSRTLPKFCDEQNFEQVASHIAQSDEAGGVAALWGANGDALSCLERVMIEVDDSELTDDEREFLQRWAKALQVPIAVLIVRILSAAVEGDQYIQMRPED